MYDAEGGRTMTKNIIQRYASDTMLPVHNQQKIQIWVTNEKDVQTSAKNKLSKRPLEVYSGGIEHAM